MRIQNISGQDGTFTLGNRTRSIAALDVLEIPDNEENYIDALAHAARGTLRIIEAPQSFGVALQSVPPRGIVKFTGNTSNGNTITLAGNVFAFAADADSVSAGQIWVAAAGTAAASAEALAEAIAANPELGLKAYEFTLSAVPHVIVVDEAKVTGSGLTLAKSGANIAVSGATFDDGSYGAGGRVVFYSHTVTAAEAAAQVVFIPTKLDNFAVKIIQFWGGSSKRPITDFDGAIEQTQGCLAILSNGTNDLAEDDTISILLVETNAEQSGG